MTDTFTGLTTQQLFLGNNTYTVTIGPYNPPAPPNSLNAGGISAYVDVSPTLGISGGSSPSMPEPSSMALSLLGLTTAGLGWWRKRRLS